MTWGRGWALALGGIAGGCSAEPFQCASDVQCVQGSVQGQCLGLGSCAFPDEACESGLRFAEHAFDGAGQCVPLMSTTTTTTGPMGSTSTTSSTTTPVGDGSSTSTTGVAEESSSTGEPLDPDLVVWYRFEGPDLMADAGPSGLGAVCVGGQCPIAADDRGALFDGIDDALRVDAGAMLDLPAPWSLALWVRRDADYGGVFRSVVAKPVGTGTANSWEIGMTTAWFLGTAANGVNTELMPIGEWTHFALRYDGSTLVAFENGTAIGEVAVDTIPYDMQPMMIGADIDNQAVENYFPGTIDDVRIYARALDEAELAAIMAEAGAGG